MATSKRSQAVDSTNRSDTALTDDLAVTRNGASSVPDESRKEEILAATLRLAAQEGFDKISVRKVAALAGVSPSLITYHYKTKTKLIADAWWLLHTRESRRRDETVGRVSALKRIDEGFRLVFEGTEADVTPQLRLDFWSKTARTPALLDLFIKQEGRLRDAHIAGIEASLEEGDLDASLAADLGLVEDALQAISLGVHTWAGLHTGHKDRARALQIGHLLLSRLRARANK